MSLLVEQAKQRIEDAQRSRDEAVRELKSNGMTLREIAEAVGISHQRVSQILLPPGHQPKTRKPVPPRWIPQPVDL